MEIISKSFRGNMIDMIIAVGSFLVISFLGVLTWIARKSLTKLDHLDSSLSAFQLTVEKTYVSFPTYEKNREEMRATIIDIYKENAANSKVLAKLEAHIDIANVIRESLSKIKT